MKSDALTFLETAGWPAVLVTDSGTIVRANQAANAAFAGIEPGQTSLAGSIWDSGNALTVGQYLQKAERTSEPIIPILLRLKTGKSMLFRSIACPHQDAGGQKVCLIQFLPGGDSLDSARLAGQSDGQVKSEAAPPESASAQKQKLDCALQLTRTVALDFNNALTSILGHTSLILGKMEPGHPWRNSLVEVEKSAGKAAEIAHDLAAFSRQEKDARVQVAGNLNDLVRRTVDLFQSPGDKPVRWSLQLEGRLYTVNFDEAKMQQAFMKILDNAVQAVGGDGKVIVRTRNEDVETPRQDGTIRLEAGSYVCVEFQDNGCGIAPEVLPRIFEPFFTTKKSPQHRGLGLAWVYGIITNHGGSVTVTSEQSGGATVRIFLPAQRKIVKDRAIPAAELGGAETILMVDDEDLLLTMGETVLSSFGYRVLTANSGHKALEIFGKAGDQIDLVITDLVMPKMSGREVIERLRKISPTVKIICTSGFVRSSKGEDEDTYLQKPFTSQDLLRKVKHILQASDAA